jgi:hypothetical protein
MTVRAAPVGARWSERGATTNGVAEGRIATTANAPRHDGQCECGECAGRGAGRPEGTTSTGRASARAAAEQ